MRIEKRGEGEPVISVVGSIHGDEPCGRNSIEKFLSEEREFGKPVQFIIANERALEKDERFLEADLNRSFPGDAESDLYEERLAAEIMDAVEGTRVLDLHSTRSYPEPFTNFSRLSPEVAELVRATGVEYAVYFPGDSGALGGQVDAVTVECGYQGSEKAEENAYRVIENFLACLGAVEAECSRTDPAVFRHTGSVEGSGFEFLAENFQKVEKGEVFARKKGEELEASEDFYPVLMSTDGYEDQVGNKAEKLGKLSELV